MKERLERLEEKLERIELGSKVEGESKRIREGAEAVEGKRNIEIEEWKKKVRKLEKRCETNRRRGRDNERGRIRDRGNRKKGGARERGKAEK